MGAHGSPAWHADAGAKREMPERMWPNRRADGNHPVGQRKWPRRASGAPQEPGSGPRRATTAPSATGSLATANHGKGARSDHRDRFNFDEPARLCQSRDADQRRGRRLFAEELFANGGEVVAMADVDEIGRQ